MPPMPPRAVSQIACTCQIPILCVLGLARSTVLVRSPKWEQLAALGMPASSGEEEDEGVQHRPAVPLAPCRPVLAGWIFPWRLARAVLPGQHCCRLPASSPCCSAHKVGSARSAGWAQITIYIYFFSFQMFQFLISGPARQRRSAASSLGLGRVCAVLHAASWGGT